MNVALVDLGSLMLHASRHSPVLPNMGLVLRFPGVLTADELQSEATRLASSPYGLGRRLEAPRVPGARPYWVTAPDPPPVALTPPCRTARELGRWLADELSVRHDPQRDAGWRLAATRDPEGGTVVALTLNHLFGTGRDIATTLYGGDLVAGAGNGNSHRHSSPVDYDLRAELDDSVARLRRGVTGVVRLVRDAATLPARGETSGDLIDIGKLIGAVRDRDDSRGRPSPRRVGALVRADRGEWTEAARAHDGSTTALQVAVTANLVRAARAARGADLARPVRLIVPVDLADRKQMPQASDTLGPVRLTSATVILPGGKPEYAPLTHVREQLAAAVRAAVQEVEATGRVPVAPGVVDAMRLLPDAVTSRVMFTVHARFDGAVSNVGPLPPGIMRIADHVATDAFLMAFPLGSDLAVAFAHHEDTLAMGVVADPSRLGSGPPVRERVAAELQRWGVSSTIW